MRYNDWDVLLFPTSRDSKIPLKEFRVACHVGPDPELSHSHGALGLPIMTSFIPSLNPGSRFLVSIHCWNDPGVSQFTQAYSKYSELVKLEARILVDGRTVASTSFDRTGPWPQMISSSFELAKPEGFEPLRFPHFHRELLYQNHWNPSDDVGRIKVVISEGFPRDSLSAPIQRVKNVVAFAFQHAPLDILESNGIAWPNPAMWRRPQPSTVPTYHPHDGGELHTHSPRRRAQFGTTPAFNSGQPTNPGEGPDLAFAPRSATSPDSPFPDFACGQDYNGWANALTTCGQLGAGIKTPWFTKNKSRQSNSDTSMPDLFPSHGGQNPWGDMMHISGPSLEEERVASNSHLKAPTNTPTCDGIPNMSAAHSFPHPANAPGISVDLGTPLTQSLLNQSLPLPIPPQAIPLPASEIKSRKETRHLGTANPDASSAASTPPIATQSELRRYSQLGFGASLTLSNFGKTAGSNNSGSRTESDSSSSPYPVFSAGVSRNVSGGTFNVDVPGLSTGGPLGTPLGESTPGTINKAGSTGSSRKGSKRMRNFTPASKRAIDEEDEPRQASPLDAAVGDYTEDTGAQQE